MLLAPNRRSIRHMRRRPLTTEEIRDMPGDFGKFTEFMRRLMAVPHDEMKTALDEEKRKKRTSKVASRVSGGPSSLS